MEKNLIRRQLLQQRDLFSPADRTAAAQIIYNKIISLSCWQRAKTLGIYLALPSEVPTSLFLQSALIRGQTIAAPVINWATHTLTFHSFSTLQQLSPGPKGILEPLGQPVLLPHTIDVLLVPGVGFDERRFRVGYGKGFYDAFLPLTSAFKIGLAFDFQILPVLPVDPWDQALDMIVSEKRII